MSVCIYVDYCHWLIIFFIEELMKWKYIFERKKDKIWGFGFFEKNLTVKIKIIYSQNIFWSKKINSVNISQSIATRAITLYCERSKLRQTGLVVGTDFSVLSAL